MIRDQPRVRVFVGRNASGDVAAARRRGVLAMDYPDGSIHPDDLIELWMTILTAVDSVALSTARPDSVAVAAQVFSGSSPETFQVVRTDPDRVVRYTADEVAAAIRNGWHIMG